MRNATNGTSTSSDDYDQPCRVLASDLVSLIHRIQASIELVEQTVDWEKPSCNPEAVGNVVVLDDVTPRYLGVSTTLKICKADLGAALDALLDTDANGRRTEGWMPAHPLHGL